MKNKLKKTTVGILAAVMVLLIGVTSVFAGVQKRSENFADTNYDGICDHHGTCIPGVCSGTQDGKDCADGNHDGVCNHRVAGKEAGQRRGFGRRCHR